MSKILVTGGCGYIGSHTIVDLIQSGFEVISVDNHVRSSAQTLDRVRAITGIPIRNYKIDLCKKNILRQIFIDHDDIHGIIHFAAYKSVPESVKKPLLYYHNNLTALMNLLEFVIENKIPNFVFSSSCSVYGNIESLPVTENTPIGKAECPYAYTKQIGEQMISDVARVHKLKAIILRYFNPVGAHESGLLGELPLGEPENLIPRITQSAIGIREAFKVYGTDYPTRDGTCIRDYIHIMDIASAHTKALNFADQLTDQNNCEVFNLGSSKGVTVLEAIKAFEEVSQTKLHFDLAERRPGDLPAIYSDIDKARKNLHWEPQHDIQSMLKSAWLWEQTLSKEQSV